MKLIYTLFVFLSIILVAEEAPFFPEVNHAFLFDPNMNNDVGFAFNSKGKNTTSNINLALLHQNREWDYNWIVLGFSVATPTGKFGIGYSYYGSSNLPLTANSSTYGTYIKSYESDKFESIRIAYSPFYKWVNLTTFFNFKKRTLIDQTASAIFIDFTLTSPYVLNSQLGINSKNLIGTDYVWNDDLDTSNEEEELPQYIGIFYYQPIFNFTLMVENDFCLNYSDLSLATAGVSYQLDAAIRLYAAYQSASYITATSYGLDLDLSNQIKLSYTGRVEKNDYEQLDIHSIGIGVQF